MAAARSPRHPGASLSTRAGSPGGESDAVRVRPITYAPRPQYPRNELRNVGASASEVGPHAEADNAPPSIQTV
ncbi:hypothetical protein V5799_011342 [Amblyomma americanum]|uniref:Uncharacterized protein n=1 Tax=Amblyomma americanum TaxID=6943 RepID=A0AAQ4EHE9_AMBAM